MISMLMKSAVMRGTFTEIRPKIFIPTQKENPFFHRNIKTLIKDVECNPIGTRLLEKIELSPLPIYLTKGNESQTLVYAQNNHISKIVIQCSMDSTVCVSTQAKWIPCPKQVILFHELTHAYHYCSGKGATSQITDPLVWGCDEEYKTIVGFPSKKPGRTKAKITENSFRQAEHLPERFGSWPPLEDSLSRSFRTIRMKIQNPFNEQSQMFFSGQLMGHALSAARIKTLGPLHEQNQKIVPHISAPPPITNCSIKDLGERNYCVFLINAQDVKKDVPSTEILSYWICSSKVADAVMGSECYFKMPINTHAVMAEYLVKERPRLNRAEFKIESIAVVRISELEFSSILPIALKSTSSILNKNIETSSQKALELFGKHLAPNRAI